MSEPVALVPRPKQVHDDVIDVLEQALAHARAGIIVECVVVSITNDGTPLYRRSMTDDFHRMIGEVECTKLSLWHEATFGTPSAPEAEPDAS